MFLFKYMGSLLTENNDDWPDFIENLQKDRKIWSRTDRILGREGADTRTSGSFNIAIFQAILLFGLETWVATPHINQILGGFHHRVERRIFGKITLRQAEGTW